MNDKEATYRKIVIPYQFQAIQLSAATYNCEWYNLNLKQKKKFLLLLIHSQGSININAYGLLKINFNTFGRVNILILFILF